MDCGSGIAGRSRMHVPPTSWTAWPSRTSTRTTTSTWSPLYYLLKFGERRPDDFAASAGLRAARRPRVPATASGELIADKSAMLEDVFDVREYAPGSATTRIGGLDVHLPPRPALRPVARDAGARAERATLVFSSDVGALCRAASRPRATPTCSCASRPCSTPSQDERRARQARPHERGRSGRSGRRPANVKRLLITHYRSGDEHDAHHLAAARERVRRPGRAGAARARRTRVGSISYPSPRWLTPARPRLHRLAVRQRLAARRPPRRRVRARRRLRALPAPARQRRADGLGHRRARHAGHRARRPGGRHPGRGRRALPRRVPRPTGATWASATTCTRRTDHRQPPRGRPGRVHDAARQAATCTRDQLDGFLRPDGAAASCPTRYIEGECPHCHYRARARQPVRQLRPAARARGPDQARTRGSTRRRSSSGARPSTSTSTCPSSNSRCWTGPRPMTHWRPNVYRFTLNFLEGGLQPRAITRDLTWGVPLPPQVGPGWDDKRIYVWFEACSGYLSAAIEWAKRHQASRTPGSAGGRTRPAASTTSSARTTSRSTP